MNYKRLISLWVALITLTFSFSTISFAESYDDSTSLSERITDYQSDIIVNSDSSMTVKETISVICLGYQIKRGIYRDFPTTYYDSYKNKYVVDFKVTDVLRDGNTEPYRIESINNGKRIYIGGSNVYLSPGRYTYTITYYTNRQLGFFKDHDELYWNVTGNGWVFPIDRASAKVTLPNGIQKDSIKLEAYTGMEGSKDKNYTSFVDENNNPVFLTTAPLSRNEGLTIVVGWPKGFVNEPTSGQKVQYFLKDNLAGIFSIISVLLVLSYYLIMWNLKGRDPKKGTIIPLYEPPDGLSPAGIRFIKKMTFDKKTLTAAIIDMAVKGYLKIEEIAGSSLLYECKYKLVKNNIEEEALSSEEKVIGQNLFDTTTTLKLSQYAHATLQDAINAGEESLKRSYENKYFTTNSKYFYIGCIISIISVVINMIMSSIGKPIILFMSVWLSGWSIGVVSLLIAVTKSWMGMGPKKIMGVKLFSTIYMTLFSIPFIIGEFIGIGVLILNGGTALAALLLLLLVINVCFYFLIRAYTIEGRKLLDSIEGFKLFLRVAEKDRLNYEFPLDKTPELFEKYLPYALALDVEQEWAEQFSDVFANISNNQGNYTPSWYYSSLGNNIGITDFTSSFSSSFTSAISSSSTPPGSSSGFSSGGGGGSSGGGGGGGGGGGW